MRSGDLLEAQGNATYPFAINGLTDQASGAGVYGYNSDSSGIGVWGEGTYGVYAVGANYGLYAIDSITYDNGSAIYGRNLHASGYGLLVAGSNELPSIINTNGSGGSLTGYHGVEGWATNAATGIGVMGTGNNLDSIYLISYGAGGNFNGTRTGAYGVNTVENVSGTGYYYGQTYNGVWGDGKSDDTANRYHFGVHGTMWVNANSGGRRTGGVLGSHEDNDYYNCWGALGYIAGNGNYYGAYGSTNYVSGGGKSTTVYNGTGVSGFGSLFGGTFRGQIYGMAVKGERYAIYTDGANYTNDLIAQINEVPELDTRIPTYMTTSTTVDVIARGRAIMKNGVAIINFDKAFTALVSDSEPITITVTPIGKYASLYIDNYSKSGMTVKDASYKQDVNSKNNIVEFSWIAIGIRKGYEEPQVPKEILEKDFDAHLDGFLFNDSDTANSGSSMWWDGQNLHFDEPINEGGQLKNITTEKILYKVKSIDVNSPAIKVKNDEIKEIELLDKNNININKTNNQ